MANLPARASRPNGMWCSEMSQQVSKINTVPHGVKH
jgi:hypothetical protein